MVAGEKKAPDVTAQNTKCMLRRRAHNAGQIHNLKMGNKSFERVGQFRYLATTLTDHNSILTEIKADCIQAMFGIIRCRIFCVQFATQKYKD